MENFTKLFLRNVNLKHIFALTFLSIFSIVGLNGQTVFWTEDFETDGTGSRYTAADQFIDGLDGSVEDFFGRIEHNSGTPRVVDLVCAGGASANLDITNAFGAPNGNFYMAGEDMNDGLDASGCGTFNTGTPLRSVSFTGININGASAITGRILVANGASDGCNTTNARWDSGEGLKVYTNIDGGGETAVLCFAPTITCGTPSTTNEPLYTDDAGSTGGACSGDGTGGTFLSNTFTEFTFVVTTGGGFTSMDLRIEIDADAGDEEIAFDYIRLEAMTVPLPVELISFDAEKQNEEIKVMWATAAELNNDHFQVEHSIDGTTFERIGIVEGKGTTELTNNYDFMHKNPINGINYYRLKQMDFDGAFEYSNVRAVDFRVDNVSVNIYPNPFTEEIKIELPKTNSKNTLFEIYDMMGRVVFTGVLEKDQLSKDINLSSLQSGVFILRIGNGENAISQRIIKL